MNTSLYLELNDLLKEIETKFEGFPITQEKAKSIKRKLNDHEQFPYRWDGRKHLTDYDLYLEATDQLDAHDPNTGDDPIWAERLDLEYDEGHGQYLNPYKDGVLQ